MRASRGVACAVVVSRKPVWRRGWPAGRPAVRGPCSTTPTSWLHHRRCRKCRLLLSLSLCHATHPWTVSKNGINSAAAYMSRIRNTLDGPWKARQSRISGSRFFCRTAVCSALQAGHLGPAAGGGKEAKTLSRLSGRSAAETRKPPTGIGHGIRWMFAALAACGVCGECGELPTKPS